MSGSVFTDASSSVHSVSDARKCLVLGCRKKHSYAKINGRKMYSRYCFRHTCEVTSTPEEGYHCQIPVENGGKYCTMHAECLADRCHEQRPDNMSGPWYCQNHRCTKDDCQSATFNHLQRRCIAHETCEAPQCTSSPDRAGNSSFCRPHTCQHPSCPNQAHPRTGHCSDHAACSNHTCDRPRFLHPGGRVDSRCEIHKNATCAITDCNARRLHATKPYCLDHGCRIAKCAEERYPGGGTLCAVHKCTLDTCFDPIAQPDAANSLFCTAHACRAPDCLYSRQPPSAYCARHKCQIKSCQRAACDGPGSLCATHDPRKNPVGEKQKKAPTGCVEVGCERPRLSVQFGEEEVDLARCLKHDRAYVRGVVRERDEWREKYERLVRETEEKRESKEARERKRRHATVEDSEDSELF